MQNFLRVHDQVKYSWKQYGFTILIVLFCYAILGNIPLTLAYFSADVQNGDPIDSLQLSYGLNTTFVLVILPLVFTAIGIIASIRYVHQRKVLSIFTGKSKFGWKRFSFSFLCWFGVNSFIFLLGFNEQVTWNYIAEFWPLLLIAIALVPLQCIAEELLFRGILWQWLGKFISSPWVIILLTGGLFGLLHIANPEVVALGKIALTYYVWVGLYLGILTYIDNGLELSLGYHIANNLFATIIVTTNWQVFQTNALFVDKNLPEFTGEMLWQMLLGQAILLGGYYLFFRINKPTIAP